jgi:CHAT domain
MLFEWSERARAGRRRHAPVRPPDDEGLAAELAELRRIAGEVRARQSEADDVGDLVAEQRRVERAVQQRHLRTAGTSAASARPPALATLRQNLGDRSLLSLVEVDGRLLAVTATSRRSAVHDLGAAAAAADAAAASASSLRALADPALAGPRRSARVDLLRRSLDALDRIVRPALAGDGPVLVVLPASLHAVPWGAVPSLSGRPVGVVPSASWWLELPPVRGVGGAAFVAAGPRLALADAEAHAVASRYAGARVVTGDAATGAAVREGLRTAEVSHVVAHGRIRHDSPSWSSLELADGPLCLYELERDERTSAVVVLSACDSGVGVRAGDQLVGLSSCLLGLGTRSLVASVCRLPDTTLTAALMGELHDQLGRTGSVAHALAALDRGAPGDERWVHAACLATFGEA